MSTLAWTAGRIELVSNMAGDLELIKAKPGSDEKYLFDENSLASLWANILESKLHMRAAHLVLHGSETYPDSGFPIALDAAIMKTSRNDKVYAFRYDDKQIRAFKPKGFALRLKYSKPCLYVFSTDFTFASMKKGSGGGAKRPALTFARVNVDGETAPTMAEAPKAGPRRQG